MASIMTLPLVNRMTSSTAADDQVIKKHWGYEDEYLPCKKDANTCAYFTAIYSAHDTSMLYTFITWAVIGGILLIWIVFRLFAPRGSRRRPLLDLESRKSSSQSFAYRAYRSMLARRRHYLLPEILHGWFGHTTRLQITIAMGVLVYLTIFSFIGITYASWITPTQDKAPGVYHNRTTLSSWGNRVGILAYALLPLAVALSTRESILSLVTGIPYQAFNFLHRWLGYIMFIQAFFHSLAWTIIEGRLYQPQPSYYQTFMKSELGIFGVLAMLFITILFVFSTQWAIRWTGYEVFRKMHILVGLLYIGMCWGHWPKLACWMIASFGIIGLDRGLRLFRSALIHLGCLKGELGKSSFASASSPCTDKT